MSAANIREVIENFDAVELIEQITLTGNQTIDLSEIRSKTIISRVSGKPAIITDASTGLIVGGQPGGTSGDFNSNTYAPQFFGDWFLYNSGTLSNGTRGVFVNANTYRLHFDRLWVRFFGGGIQGTMGDIRTLTINRFAVWDFMAFQSEFFSRDPLKEVDSIFIDSETEGNTVDVNGEATHYSWGPSVGSSGKIGAVVANGIPYRQAYGSYHWSTRFLTAASWSSGVLTLTTRHYHSVSVGDDVYVGGFDNTAYNNLTTTPWTAISGTEGKTIKVVMASDPGSYTKRGYFTYSYGINETAGFNDFERPRNITYRNVSLRGQREGGHYVESGDNIVFDRCVVDDAGVSDPYAYNCSGVWAAVEITGITQANPGVVTTAAAHPYSTGATVPIAAVVGMTQVNDLSFTITKLTDTTFSIGVDTSGYTAYSSGGTAGGTATFSTWEADGTTPRAHTMSVADYCNTRLFQPSGYNISAQVATVPTIYTLTVPMVDNPGAASSTSNGDFYKPLSLNAHGFYFGQRAGSYKVLNSKANENYGAGIYDDRLTDERSEIIGNRIFNSRYGYPDAPDPDKMGDLYFRPGRANMTVTDNKLGAGDTWRFASKSWVFAANPAAGEYVWLRLNADTEPTYFIFVSSDPSNDSSQPEVLIGATVAATIANLRDAVHARDDATCRAVRATPTDANGTPDEATSTRLLITRNAPGAVGKDMTIGEASTQISLSPSGASLAGGTGQATINYNIMNISDGERGNIVQRNATDSHTDAASNMSEASTVVVIRPNLLDNGDFSIDQRNEGASVTISSSGATSGAALVDRWFGNRSGSNITAQRVTGERQPYALRITGASGNTAAIVRQRIEGGRAQTYVGRVVTLSVQVKSPTITKCALRLSYATALDNFAADTNIAVRQYVIGTSLKKVSFTTLIPSGGANGIEASIRFTDGIGAAATVTIEEFKLEESGIATDFVADLPEDNLFSCQRYYRKTFPVGTVPAQNAGVTGALVEVQSIAGAVSQQFASLTLAPPMRAAATITLYNPSATNAQIRNTVAGADWSLSAAGSITANGFVITGTGPGGGAAGDESEVHYTADADFS
jgi:hypothetical protein